MLALDKEEPDGIQHRIQQEHYITAAVAFVVTVYGRFTAKQVVTLTGGPTPPATSLTGTKG